MNLLLTIVSVLFSGWFDSRGFIHADKTWLEDGSFSLTNALLTYFYFAVGLVCYLLAIKFCKTLFQIPPSLQTAAWFIIVMVGLAITKGDFFQWKRTEQAVSLVVISGIVWLILQGKS